MKYLPITHSRVRSLLLVTTALCGLTSCSAPPQTYALGSRIPFGDADISVSSPEFSVGQNGHLLAIRLYYDPKQGKTEKANQLRSKFINAFLLRDGTGRKFGPVLPMTVAAYRALKSVPNNMSDLEALAAEVVAPPDGRNWMAVFPVKPGAQNFTLEIKGPSVTAMVALGR